MWKWKSRTYIWNYRLTINVCCRHWTIIFREIRDHGLSRSGTVRSASAKVRSGAWSIGAISIVIGAGFVFVSVIVAVPGNGALDMGDSIPLRAGALVFPEFLMQPVWYGVSVSVCASFWSSDLVLVYIPPWISGVNITMRAYLTVSSYFFISTLYHFFGSSCWISESGFHFSLPRDSIEQISKNIPRIFSRPKFSRYFSTLFILNFQIQNHHCTPK